MNFELHIASPSASGVLEKHRNGDPGGNPPKILSEFSGLSLLARIWMWLSQIWGRETYTEAAQAVFCLGADDALNGHRFQNLISTDGLGRRERRMLARYDRLGLSYAQAKAWMKARIKRQKFQTALVHYYSLAFFRRVAHALSRKAGHAFSQDESCKAPLSPD